MNSNITQGFERWQSEVNFLGSLSHSHLVRLLGYCCEDEELLVYGYMPRGSLENYLFRRTAEPLSWDRRISIALGAARGLAFLHSLDQKVIYRDFKTSNISSMGLPRDMHMLKKENVFKSVERELIFDVDMTDHDDVLIYNLVPCFPHAILWLLYQFLPRVVE